MELIAKKPTVRTENGRNVIGSSSYDVRKPSTVGRIGLTIFSDTICDAGRDVIVLVESANMCRLVAAGYK